MSSNPQITFILGTRPEIIKLAPLIRCCDESDIPYSILHTGQHYSEELDEVFFDQLGLPNPHYNLEVGSDTHGHQTAEMIKGIEDIVVEQNPSVVLVQGDTNSVLAGSLALSKLDIPIGHIEAGLRSFDRSMPEEINRILADHAGDYLFAPTQQSYESLQDEALDDGRIFMTGNTIVDAVHQHQGLASEQSNVLSKLDLQPQEFGLLTAHRAENVDSPDCFSQLIEGARRVGEALGIDIIYPIHPRAEERLTEFGLSVPEQIRVVDPQDYLDFLKLEANATLILTDSGGVQEEACILGVPCVTVRQNTERPETIDVGSNVLAGTNPDSILEQSLDIVKEDRDWENPFGDGTAVEQILEILSKETEVVYK